MFPAPKAAAGEGSTSRTRQDMRTREPKLIEGIAILKNFEVAMAKMFELGLDVAAYCL